MGQYHRIASTQELAEGSAKKFLVQGTEILLAKVNGKYYAAENRCPHMGGDLSQGHLEGNVITCPRHGSQFDLTDGSVIRWLKSAGLISSVAKALRPPRKLTTYNVKIEGNDVMVELQT